MSLFGQTTSLLSSSCRSSTTFSWMAGSLSASLAAPFQAFIDSIKLMDITWKEN